MGAVYKSICYEADTVLLLSIRLAEKEINLKLEIENLMNEGIIKIAKARYIMGSTCVTKMQLPTENSNPIKAIATVGRRNVNNSWIFYIIRQNCLKNNESNGNISGDHGESMESNSGKFSTNNLGTDKRNFKCLLQTDPKSLKKSKNAFLIEDDQYQECNDEFLDEMSNCDSDESLFSITDPLRLFGILVPSALKEAQVIFNSVVNLLGECATVQLELQETLDKLHHLRKVKSLIEAASKDMRLNILTPKVYWTPTETSSTSCYSSESEKPEEFGELSKFNNVNIIQKSIRSVFYDVKDIEPQEADLQIWGSGQSVSTELEDPEKL